MMGTDFQTKHAVAQQTKAFVPTVQIGARLDTHLLFVLSARTDSVNMGSTIAAAAHLPGGIGRCSLVVGSF